MRWTLACLLLAPFVWTDLRTHHLALAAQWRRITLLGFLGMWVCGGIVYVALRYTTATHGTLIYTGSPVLVVLIAAIMARRHVPVTQAVGPAVTSVFMYLLPCYGVVLAILLLGEHFHHAGGARQATDKL